MSSRESWSNSISRVVGALGVVSGAGCGAVFLAMVSDDSNGYLSIQRAGYVMLVIAYCAPYAFGIAALNWNLAERAGMMLGGGVVTLVFAIPTMGLVAGVFFLLGAAMLVGGLIAMIGSRSKDWPSGAALLVAVLVFGSAANASVKAIPGDGGCWQTIRQADGTRVESYFAAGVDYPNPPPGLPPGAAVTRDFCLDDVISWPEIALSAGALLLEFGLIIFLRRNRAPAIAKESYAIP